MDSSDGGVIGSWVKQVTERHSPAKNVSIYLSDAIKLQDQMSVVVLLSELMDRHETKLAVKALEEIANSKNLMHHSSFELAVSSLIANYGYSPFDRIWRNILNNGGCIPTSDRLLAGTEYAGLSVLQGDVATLDSRVDKFLRGFFNMGDVIVSVGFRTIVSAKGATRQDDASFAGNDRCGIMIADGEIRNSNEVSKLSKLLDAVGIKNALPAFRGEWGRFYILSDYGSDWRPLEKIEDKKVFYVIYRFGCFDRC